MTNQEWWENWENKQTWCSLPMLSGMLQEQLAKIPDRFKIVECVVS